LNYIGNYDYYLEKKNEVEKMHFGAPVDNLKNTKQEEITTTKLDWKQQKEEQAKIRKRENELKRTEEEIHKLETRNEQIDELLTKEDIYTNVSKLMELNNEKKTIESKLEEL